NSLCGIHVELSSKCNKSCWMCGRRKVEKNNPGVKYGDMDFSLVEKIARELPSDIVVQFHKDGESMLYPRLGEAIKLFNRQITSLTTNGKLLGEKAGEIIGVLDTLSVSVIEKDNEADDQYEILKKFLEMKGDKKPFVNAKLVGKVDSRRYEKLGLLIVRRALHDPMGSFKYRKKNPAIPEIGICWALLKYLVINREGKVSICARFDPDGMGVIGNANTESLDEIWNCDKRKNWIQYHKIGRRNEINLCQKCEFWGVPTNS
ncbi:MAG: SPASM domain-containing protein, partial [Patescibacteria group bacterium]